MPPGPFQKPTLVEVAVASSSDRAVPEAGQRMKVWFGLLAPSLSEAVIFDHPEAPEIDLRSGDRPCLPLAQALVEVAENQFGFLTAPSQAPDRDPNVVFDSWAPGTREHHGAHQQ